jgi:hypothetical protein
MKDYSIEEIKAMSYEEMTKTARKLKQEAIDSDIDTEKEKYKRFVVFTENCKRRLIKDALNAYGDFLCGKRL